ncbi:MAG: universal stress protein [Myxococcota bacterium]
MTMRLAVAVDLEDDAPERVLDAAIRWAAQLGGALDVVYVMRASPVPATLGSSDPQVLRVVNAEIEQHRRREAARLTQLVGRIPEANRGVARLLEGAAVDALVAAGERYEALLVATHGRSGLAHFWLGSVADVVRQARCTVVVLRVSPAA